MDDAPPAQRLRRSLQQVFRRFGILGSDQTPCGQPLSPAHAHALMVLLDRGELVQGELATELGVDKSTLARLVPRLVAFDHVERRTDAADGRVRRVRLTPRGERLALRLSQTSLARFAAVLEAVEPEKRALVVDALEVLAAAMPPPVPLRSRARLDEARPSPLAR
ncbi:MarR family winged helix-turn-helix transcriptional regulator [Myxococcota bacterium]|nr:MarR family winged helix-turn-helix transcriptional regulator [Myxococcota bacterium]